jgi:putative tryptophan/tyrosine transport system substrate-binding protein
MRRREFIILLGGTVAGRPLAVRAQPPTMPVVGLLHSQSADGYKEPLRGFRQGLKEAGYIEGENVAIEYRFAESQIDLLPVLAADLVRRPLAVIVAAGGPPVVVSAKEVTSTIPGDDPVRLGYVASLARSGGNLTGISFFNAELATKRLELLHTLVPSVLRIAVLLDPTIAAVSNATLRDLEPAARAMGMQIQAVNASTSGEINTAFASFARERLDAMFVGPSAFFLTRRVQLAQLAARHGFPAIYAERDYVDVGGLMSYGTNITDAYRQVGVYTGRILKGAKPADLPVLRASKFELIINAETARMLGLTVPPTLLATADEVIE